MVSKRPATSRESSCELIEKKRRRGLHSLERRVSPPPPQRQSIKIDEKSTAAAIEAGEKSVQDHLTFYSSNLLAFVQPIIPGQPRVPYQKWIDLYKRNAGSDKGCHFIVHQHDHPIAGTHYDLRLQCNPTSSISFAIMYGLPGDPNSRRLNRNATETRVHCLWNHLIETASHSTGSMLIWDTGEYEVLPYYHNDAADDTGDEADVRADAMTTEQHKLREGFRERKLKLRLHGTRLPAGYTILVRLTRDNYRSEQPSRPSRRRRRLRPTVVRDPSKGHSRSQSNEDDLPWGNSYAAEVPDHHESEPASPKSNSNAAVASDDEHEIIRANNAYSGATNDIGSVHQRKWYLSMDRNASGFRKMTKQSDSGFTESWWISTAEEAIRDGFVGAASGFPKFLVQGRDVERSVITGRLASDILRDEGVAGYVPRGLWRPVTE